MSHIGEKVKQLRDIKKLSNSEYAKLLDMTENNLFSIYRREDTTTDLVKKIMKATGVSSTYFFEDKPVIISQNGNVNTLGVVESKVNYTTSKTDSENIEIAVLKVQLESKDKEIEYLKQIVEMLKSGR